MRGGSWHPAGTGGAPGADAAWRLTSPRRRRASALTVSHVNRYLCHHERHAIDSVGWLRAGASDARPVLVAGVAGLVAGSLSMAAGGYVSVASQADLEAADSARETRELHEDPEGVLEELTHIYQRRAPERELAAEVATRLTDHDALGHTP